MTPGRFWESDDAGDVIDSIILGKWFKTSDRIAA